MTLVGGFAIYAFALMVLVLITSIAMAKGATPSHEAVEFAMLGSSLVAALAGGYATASLAPNRQRGHVTVLAAMMLLSHINRVVHPTAGASRWYPIVLALVSTAAVVAGGLLRRPRSPSLEST